MSAYTLTKQADVSSLKNQPNTALLDEVVHRIVKTINPEKVVLFGSGARGEMQSTSDLDILVIAPSALPRYRRSVPLYLALSNILMPMDIVVYTPEEVDEWRNVRQVFVTTALREGRVLYERQE